MDDHEDSRYGQDKPDRTLVYGSAIGCLVIIIGCVIYFGFLAPDTYDPRRGKKKKKKHVEASAEPTRAPIEIPEEEEDPGFGEEENTPEPEPEPEPEVKPKKKPEKKPEEEQPKKKVLPPLPPAKVRKIDHLESTPADQKTEIDEAVAVVSDPWETRKAVKNKKVLLKIGKAALPALLSAMVELDFTEREGRLVMPIITETLQEITKCPNSWICRVGMRETEEEEVHYCKYHQRLWFEWYDSSKGKRFMSGE